MCSGRCKLRRLLSVHFIRGTFVHILHIFVGMRPIAGVGGPSGRMLMHAVNGAHADSDLGKLNIYMIILRYTLMYRTTF